VVTNRRDPSFGGWFFVLERRIEQGRDALGFVENFVGRVILPLAIIEQMFYY
jgi:hypothetical protein